MGRQTLLRTVSAIQRRVQSKKHPFFSDIDFLICRIYEFFSARAISDPFISGQIYHQKPTGKIKNDLVAKLKESQKDTENRIHPWMPPEIQTQIRGLTEEGFKQHRATVLANDGIDGVTNVFRGNRSRSSDNNTIGGINSSQHVGITNSAMSS